MAYCPQCGREQNCGCEICHICGVELVDRRAAPTPVHARSGSTVPVGDSPDQAVPAVSTAPRDQSPEEGARWLEVRSIAPPVFLVLGCAALIIMGVGMIRAASNFTGMSGTISVLDGLKRLGYYLGHIMYSSSYPLLLGFGFVALGLMWDAPGPFSGRQTWRGAVRAAGLGAFAVGACCLIAFILLMIPVGNQGVYMTNLLPQLWVSLPVLAVLGVSFLVTGYIMAAQLARQSK